MVVAASAAAAASMVSVIPVVVTTGIVWRMAETMMPRPGEAKPRRKRSRRSVYSRENSGNFSNIGF